MEIQINYSKIVEDFVKMLKKEKVNIIKIGWILKERTFKLMNIYVTLKKQKSK